MRPFDAWRLTTSMGSVDSTGHRRAPDRARANLDIIDARRIDGGNIVVRRSALSGKGFKDQSKPYGCDRDRSRAQSSADICFRLHQSDRMQRCLLIYVAIAIGSVQTVKTRSPSSVVNIDSIAAETKAKLAATPPEVRHEVGGWWDRSAAGTAIRRRFVAGGRPVAVKNDCIGGTGNGHFHCGD